MPTTPSSGQPPAKTPDSPVCLDPRAAAPLIRQATVGDAGRLAQWLDAGVPVATLRTRDRRAMLDALLSHPESGPCVVAEAAGGGMVQGVLVARLTPRLDLAGLAALATEWWCLRPGPESGAMLAFCMDWLVDWCRAHGVRHLLLPAGLAALGPQRTVRLTALADGLLHLDLKPAAKHLA